ncbi:MAG: hypothetical protein NTU54_04560 [Candidatus Omnitrophica bacterium]|nr:hypothetical protein [Candidatus Omnitrophota bacterium]
MNLPAAITGAYAGDYASSNRVYNECLSLRDACVKALNDFLTTYAQKGLPSAQFFSADPAIHNEGVDPDNLTTDFYDLSLNINSYLAKINNPPIARLAEVPAQKLSYTFKLNNAFCSDPDKDKLSSRWVITAIPDTAEAKSQTYVVYQKLSATDIAVLTPDLAGDWQVTLDINDAQDGNEAVATMNAIRRILWVQHNDKDTYLSNYAYTSEELSCEFNQEIAPEKAGVYLNYDDLGKPVDQIEYTLPQNTQYCFTLEKVRGEYDHSKGKYDGLMGSTPLQSDAFRYHPDVGAFNLASSASSDEFAILKVEAVDSSITDLVLSTKQSLYGFKVSYPNKRIGTYQIKQWVDNYAWINMDGKGFVKYDRKASGACHPCPDWLEERAARVLNESEPYLRQYVQRILPSATEGEFGHFDPKNPRNIYLDDYNVRMRYNLPVASEYGWFVVMALDGNARHEAHHIWYYNEMIRKGLKDADQDWLPADSAGGKIVYLQDSASNFCGAKLTGIFNPVEPGIVYLGDNQSDAVEEALAPGSKKEFLSYYSVADSNGEFVKEIENVVPQALPMKRYAEIKIKEIWIPMTDSSTVFLKEGVDYTYTVYPIAGDRQGILVNLNTAVVVGKIHSNNMGKYVIEYNVIMSVPPGENDACRIMPGTFVGGA